jgi:hypothetical protein
MCVCDVACRLMFVWKSLFYAGTYGAFHLAAKMNLRLTMCSQDRHNNDSISPVPFILINTYGEERNFPHSSSVVVVRCAL